ncbi:trehalose-6-phosphate synthase [Acinetobacter halotolerans]|uniref:Trehalose-6-phosphate synthase n=1 Tax=Acinetobacter halotolerans TaxID=1752076 RepID=A0A4Q6XJD8_9GAMM|nr:trehalose-6-phosphate synthase [Acinetobacter halotolerans]RZF55865.1 trehalose-6-phosphate synthase [Acinetobacter halotolerans]
MSKLIILSNRVSIPNAQKPSAGGLAVAIQDALDDVGGIWLGWNGETVHTKEQINFDVHRKGRIDYVTCPLTENQYASYYAGFANNALWPAMHHRSDLIEYKLSDYEGYQQVNYLFAKKLAEISEPDDTIWVHDYHFLSVAKYCRELGMQNKIGFFLHIPFAPLFIWQKIPSAPQLIENLCQYDVVGLQTEKDQKICMQVCTSLLKAQKIQRDLLSFHQRLTTIKCYPIGVNPAAIQRAAQQFVDTKDFLTRTIEVNSPKTIIGVDRIDYSKGLLERFISYAEFLEKYPEYKQHIQHLQIACPCRLEVPAYQRLFERFKIKIDLINQEFAQNGWQPIECSYDAIKHHHLMQIYRQADVCWISSIRDGMNLVAKEFVAAQDPANPGVLILSKYAGAAERMAKAILVDPTDKLAMVNALKTALEMPKQERISRYKQLIKGLKDFDINDWRNAFLNDLQYETSLQDFKQMGLRNVNSIYQNL